MRGKVRKLAGHAKSLKSKSSKAKSSKAASARSPP
jgi:hypothetical protein